MNPLAPIFVPRKIRTDIPLQHLQDFYKRSATVCQCLSTRCVYDHCNSDCNDNYNFLISIYNGTITVYDEDHSQFFYLEGHLSIREVLGYLGYTGDDISQIAPGWGEDVDDSLLDLPSFTHNLSTLVALQ
jgi:hypothetical protein